MSRQIKIFDSAEKLFHNTAVLTVELIRTRLKAGGRSTLVLSGGSTPKGLYELLADEHFSQKIDWQRVDLFWGDERSVPPNHPESNFRMANEALISKIPIPAENVHRIPAEKNPAQAAREYQHTLEAYFGISAGVPCFDIVLLGLGEDGHTASLFPGTAVLEETGRWVADVYLETLQSHRLTLTLPVINHARTILFLVSGQSKAEAVRKVFDENGKDIPAKLVRPVSGTVIWLLDNEAASKLGDLTVQE